MKPNDLPSNAGLSTESTWGDSTGALPNAQQAFDLLSPLMQGPVRDPPVEPTAVASAIPSVVLGELLALANEGQTALVRYAGQPGTQALLARSTVDLQGHHIGQPVALMFEQGDPSLPVVLGVLRGQQGWPMGDKPAQVEVDADGERLIVNAMEQLVLRCGKASITLTKAGKVLIEGSYVLSRSTGVNRIKGGSIQLN